MSSMTILLIKSLIWGDGENNALATAPTTPQTSDVAWDVLGIESPVEKDDDVGDVAEVSPSVLPPTSDNEDDEEDEKEDDEEDDEEEGVRENAEDETLEYEQIHSRFEVDFYKDIRYVLSSSQFNLVFYSYVSFVAMTMSLAAYELSLDGSYVEFLKTPNLPFCEKPFSVTPFMAQGASAMAHLPYVPALLLGIGYASPEMCGTLNPECNSYAHENRLFLLIQFALQLFTSVSGHMIPNPRAVMSQEISIALSFILLYNFFNLTTPQKTRNMIDSQTVSMVIAVCVSGFLTVGLLPVIAVAFITAATLEYIIPGAFSLLTPKSRLILLYSFLTCAVSLLIETIGCNWLFSDECPWHIVFDLLFWQVLGSAVDVVILSPRPGRFLRRDDAQIL